MKLNKKDFQSSNEVRWCPGCGDYGILATVQKTLADLQMDPKDTVFISGIGCAARFPYYMNTYGMHTIHGRAPAFAMGVKLTNKKLNVFLVTGDGDGLSIGASHLLHLFRRNINLTVLLFNNQIYGLTKGQYSPTSNQGHVAKSTPLGALEQPINPISFALSAKASFVARSIDNNAAHLSQCIKAAVAHKGTSFIEILQTCVVFNDNAFDHLRDRAKREQNILELKIGEPLLFDEGKKGIGLDKNSLLPVILDQKDQHLFLTHDPQQISLRPQILAQMTRPHFPTPIGVFHSVERATYEEQKFAQDEILMQKSKDNSLELLLRGQNTWQI